MTQMFERVSDLAEVQEVRSTFLAIGVFDGVHRGHQELLARMSAASKDAGARSAALTFYPHPRSVVPGQSTPLYLCTLQDRVQLLAEQGIDLVITHPFNEKVRKTTATEFVERLCTHLGLSELWGGNFGLGYRREGDVGFLSRLGEEKGFKVRQFDVFAEWNGSPISSSRVRQAVREGLMEDVSALTGRSYRMAGTVIHGDGRGRTIGIPTANLAVWPEQLMPAGGVYATYAWLDGRRYPAATNIGVRPTVNGRSLIVESHLIGFEGDLYGQELTLDFESRIRDEKKFPGLDALTTQIWADIALVKKRLQPSRP
jgi:riboflavin kinase/FMN adenylyltransferase